MLPELYRGLDLMGTQVKHPFDRVLSKTATAGVNDVAMDQVEDGRLYCLKLIGVENESSACTDIRLLKGRVGATHVLIEHDNPQAATLYWVEEPIYLSEGQQLTVRFTGCSDGDELRVYIMGWWTEAREFDEEEVE